MTKFILSKNWDLSVANGYWIGGYFPVSNSSNGYHKILAQWWENFLRPGHHVLLVTENEIVKNEFSLLYPGTVFKNLEYQSNKRDFDLDLCKPWDYVTIDKFDAIVCQATFEHLFDPVQAMRNLINITNDNGEIYIHTHTPGFHYHPYPRDYLRFQPDWFEDVAKNFTNVRLLDLFYNESHIFSRYKKSDKV